MRDKGRTTKQADQKHAFATDETRRQHGREVFHRCSIRGPDRQLRTVYCVLSKHRLVGRHVGQALLIRSAAGEHDEGDAYLLFPRSNVDVARIFSVPGATFPAASGSKPIPEAILPSFRALGEPITGAAGRTPPCRTGPAWPVYTSICRRLLAYSVLVPRLEAAIRAMKSVLRRNILPFLSNQPAPLPFAPEMGMRSPSERRHFFSILTRLYPTESDHDRGLPEAWSAVRGAVFVADGTGSWPIQEGRRGPGETSEDAKQAGKEGDSPQAETSRRELINV